MSDTALRPPSLVTRAYRLPNRPYYWFRPSQLLVRLRVREGPADSTRLLRTAWGSHLECWPDSLGRAVARNGVYDLAVAETLARLADPAETAVDAGANVGLMSNLLAHAVGSRGRVISFEPHPLIFQTLSRNAERLRADDRLGVVETRQAAVSSANGTSRLAVDADTFAYNKGTASLRAGGAGDATETGAPSDATKASAAGDATEVATIRLDDALTAPVGVLKLDVEMHELQALTGAERLLSQKLVRDIVFEEHEAPPTPVTELLESHGYTILGIRQGLAGPIVSAPAEAYRRQLWDPPALLATSDPARARSRLKRRGWASLRSGLGGRAR
jgi:FkbM family methyltransferase